MAKLPDLPDTPKMGSGPSGGQKPELPSGGQPGGNQPGSAQGQPGGQQGGVNPPPGNAPRKPNAGIAGKVLSGAAKNSGGAAEKAAEVAEKAKQVAEKVQKAQRIASKAQTLLTKVVALAIKLAIPIAIIVAIILAIMLGYSAHQVIGPNENPKCADTGGGSAADVGTLPKGKDGLADMDNARNVLMSWMMGTPFKGNGNKPLSKEQAAGIIGNWTQESQLTPWAVQGLFENKPWVPVTSTNEQMLAAVQGELHNSGKGTAIGVAQWDKDRSVTFVKYAIEQGKLWSDTQVQLDFFKKEMDDGYEHDLAVKKGFFQPGRTPREYALAFEESFERAGQPAMENRYKAADEAMVKFTGSGTMGGSGSAGCSGGGGGNYDNSSIAALAISLAWPTREQSIAPGDGKSKAKPEYLKAKQDAMAKSPDPQPNLYSSCDRFVATVLKLTVDPDIPWGNSDAQFAYLSGSSKYEKITTKSALRPGDVLSANGHIMIFTGDKIAAASYHERVGGLVNVYVSEDLVGDNRHYTGFRFKK